MKILVADDQRFWREALEETLRGDGHDVICVRNGEEAWQRIQADPEITGLVTDWVMPELCGPDLCRRVRSLQRRPYLPILLLTSRGERDDLVEALDAGADAFLRKPFEPAELLAQLRVTRRIVGLEERLESQIEALQAAKSEIERDLASAAAIQRSLLPTVPPPVSGVGFAWHYEPCLQLAGDVFNVFRLSERHACVYVLDVSGHGTSAALHSVSLCQVLHPLAQQGGILKRVHANGGGFSVPTPAEVATELNRRFPLIERSGHYFTFLYGILDLQSRHFRYVRAGHPGAIWVSQGEAVSLDEGGSIPVGVSEDAEYHDEEIALASGDVLLMLTDGVMDAPNARGERFGHERVMQTVSGEPAATATQAVDHLKGELDRFRKSEPHRDDVTIVGLRVD